MDTARGAIDQASSTRDVLVDRLCAEGYRFQFFKAVWLLERSLHDREPVGCRGPVGDEGLRFRPHVSVGFPAADVRRIARLQNPENGSDFYRMDVTFMGLYGVSTPLPTHYAIDILRGVAANTITPDRESEGRVVDRSSVAGGTEDTTPTRDFLDVFHHRLVSLFYRAWLKYRYDVQYGMPGRDVMTDYLLWLVGIPKASKEHSLGVDPARLIRYAGVLTQHPKSATTLEGILSDYWGGLPVEIQQCVGRWSPIPEADLNRIGQANSTLGMDLTVGEQVYDLNSAFNAVIGPVTWDGFQAFLPDSPAFAQTRALTKLYCTDPLAFTIEIKLKANEVPEVQLGTDPNIGRLGYTCWARTDEIPETSVVFEASLAAPIELTGDMQSEPAESQEHLAVVG